MARRLRALAAFASGFVIGDDWRIAAGVVAGLAATYGVSTTGAPAWWLLPAFLAVLLPLSLWLAVRSR